MAKGRGINTVGLAFLLFTIDSCLPAAEDSLKLVQVVFRHGEKGPDVQFGIRSGLLTDAGKQQAYDLGEFVRSRYASFLSNDYKADEFEILSSESIRCVQSADLFAYGLYAEYNRRANWSLEEEIPYDPIPVQTIPKEFDNVLQISDNCPRREDNKDKAVEIIFKKIMEDNQDWVQEYIKHTGDLSVFNDSLSFTERLFPIVSLVDPSFPVETTPEWSRPYRKRQLYENFKYDFNEVMFDNPDVAPLQIGNFLSLLYSRFRNIGLGRKMKMFAYASHDFSISALLRLFVKNPRDYPADPPMGSAIFLELHQEDKGSEPYLKVFYKNGSVSQSVTELAEIPNCAYPCTLSKFWEIIKAKIPADYQQACRVEEGLNSTGLDFLSLGVIAAAIFLVVALGVYVLVVMNRKRRYERV